MPDNIPAIAQIIPDEWKVGDVVVRSKEFLEIGYNITGIQCLLLANIQKAILNGNSFREKDGVLGVDVDMRVFSPDVKKYRIVDALKKFANVSVTVPGNLQGQYGAGIVNFFSSCFVLENSSYVRFFVNPCMERLLLYLGCGRKDIFPVSLETLTSLRRCSKLQRLYEFLESRVSEIGFDERNPISVELNSLIYSFNLDKQHSKPTVFCKEVIADGPEAFFKTKECKFSYGVCYYNAQGNRLENGCYTGVKTVEFSIFFKDEKDSFSRRAEANVFNWLSKISNIQEYQVRIAIGNMRVLRVFDYFAKQCFDFPKKIADGRLTETYAMNCLVKDLREQKISVDQDYSRLSTRELQTYLKSPVAIC